MIVLGAVVAASVAAVQARGDSTPAPMASQPAEEPSTCPDPRQVAASLAELLRADGAEPVPEGTVRVVDQGETWRLVVAGHETSYRDPDRNCVERAHLAAVAAALTLRPPRLGLPPPPPPPSRPAPAAETGAAGAAASFLLEAGPTASLALHDGARRVATGGGDLSAVLRLTRIDVAVTAGFRAASDYALAGVTAGVTRVPFGLALGGRTHGGRLELAGRIGVAGAVLLVGARDLSDAPHRERFELGPSATILIAWPASSRLAVVAGAGVSWMPRPYALDVSPDGTVGHSAWLYLETYLALRLSMFR